MCRKNKHLSYVNRINVFERQNLVDIVSATFVAHVISAATMPHWESTLFKLET